MSTSEVGMVDMKKITALLTCPLCKEIFIDATSIVECLHTFCKNCISKKIMEEDLDHCPVCNQDLGCHPFEKLRADMHWKHMSETFFPKPVDDESSIPLPARRKERSLSSLGVNSAETSRQNRVTYRRSRLNAKNNPSPQNQNASVDDSNSAKANEKKDLAEIRNLSQKLPIIPEDPPVNDFSKQLNLNDVTLEIGESSTQEADLWKPLSSLADIAIGEGSGTSAMEEDTVKLVQVEPQENEAELPRMRSTGRGNRNKPHVDHREIVLAMAAPAEPRRLRSSRRRAKTATQKTNVAAQAPRTAVATQNTNVTPQAQRASSSSTQKRNVPAQAPRAAASTANTNVSVQARAQAVLASSVAPDTLRPIWFSLTAGDDHCVRQGYSLLPQIPSKFIKVSERDLPVSYIHKYLAKKLDLASDAEVQVFLRGAPIPPTLQLNHLLNYWLQTTPKPERIQTHVGSSGEDFVLPLSYARIRPV